MGSELLAAAFPLLFTGVNIAALIYLWYLHASGK